MSLFNYRCDHCGALEERAVTDTYTRRVLCLTCIGAAWYYTTNSPDSEGDNLSQVLDEQRPQEVDA